MLSNNKLSQKEREVAITHLANILGRTFEELLDVYSSFATKAQPERLLHIVYWLGKLAIDEVVDNNKRTVTFSPVLRERLGHHIHGEMWSNSIKEVLKKNNLLERPIHIISANLHSVMNTFHAPKALKTLVSKKDIFEVYEDLSKDSSDTLRDKVSKLAISEGMIYIKDKSGTNINVQIFDTAKIDFNKTGLKIQKMDIDSEILLSS